MDKAFGRTKALITSLPDILTWRPPYEKRLAAGVAAENGSPIGSSEAAGMVAAQREEVTKRSHPTGILSNQV